MLEGVANGRVDQDLGALKELLAARYALANVRITANSYSRNDTAELRSERVNRLVEERRVDDHV